MNNRARRLLDERFGEWLEATEGWWCRRRSPDSSNAVPCSHHGVRCWLSSPSGFRFATADEAKAALDVALLRSIIEPVVGAKWGPWVSAMGALTRKRNGVGSGSRPVVWDGNNGQWCWRIDSGDFDGFEEATKDAAKLAADFALYCEIVDAQRSATDVLLEKVNEAVRKLPTWSAPMPDGVLFSEGFESVPWVAPPPRIPVSFRAKLADEWELRANGRHVRKATWEGMEFVAIEIVRSQKVGKIATFRCPGQASRSTVIAPCGWSKKDRRYLSQLWALWSEHHQEVPGSDWREVAKARLGVK